LVDNEARPDSKGTPEAKLEESKVTAPPTSKESAELKKADKDQKQ